MNKQDNMMEEQEEKNYCILNISDTRINDTEYTPSESLHSSWDARHVNNLKFSR